MITSLALAGPGGVEEARGQGLGQVDLTGPLEAVEQTQDALQGVAGDALAPLSPPDPPTADPPPEGGAGGGGSVEPAPLPSDTGGEDAAPPPSTDSASGAGASGSPSPPAAGSPAQRPDGAAPAPERSRDSPGERSRPKAAPRSGLGNATRPVSGEAAGAPTTLERIVAVVPVEIKLALGVLLLAVAGSLFSARRTRAKLARAEQRAATDPLTQLPNRISAEEVLERLVAQARRNGRPMSAALFDLDHFKAVNDSYGHGVGDEALRTVARAARTTLRGGDHVARYGGEEFLLLLPDTDREGAVTAAETLRKKIASLEIEGPGTVTASFGVASMPADATNPFELLSAADRALYAAKEAGRDRVETAGRQAVPLEPVA